MGTHPVLRTLQESCLYIAGQLAFAEFSSSKFANYWPLTIPKDQVVDSPPMGVFEPFSEALEFNRHALWQFQAFDKCKKLGEITWRTRFEMDSWN